MQEFLFSAGLEAPHDLLAGTFSELWTTGSRAAAPVVWNTMRVKIIASPLFTVPSPSRLNQIEIYLSIIHREAFTFNDFPSPEALNERIFDFERHYEAITKPVRVEIHASRHFKTPRQNVTGYSRTASSGMVKNVTEFINQST